MPITTAWSIFYRNTATPAALETESATQATSIDNALTSLRLDSAIPRYADAGARTTANPTPTLGQLSVLTSDEVVYRYNGSAWKPWWSDWASYTPTVSGITLGAGTLVGRKKYRTGMQVHEGGFTLGAGSAVAGPVRITHDATSEVAALSNFPIGSAVINDAGTALFPAMVHRVSTTTADVRAFGTSGATVPSSALSSTFPFTFVSTDSIGWRFETTPA